MSTPDARPEVHRSETHAYTVVRELGRGGQARTALVVRDDDPSARYVLKLLRLEHVDDWKQVELFEREVTTLEALDHPGIPRLVDRIVEDGRTAGIVETFVEGRTVAQQIADGVSLSPQRFERVLRDGLDILADLRARVPPVLHRDINPANVVLGSERAWLIDFGAVRVGTKTDMTSVGTFGYMAPEQLVGRASPASDMYGLGMTLVALAQGCDVGDLPVDDATGRLDDARVLGHVQPRVRDVVLAMVRPGLEQRLSDPAEALRRLDARVAERDATPTSIASAPASARRPSMLVVAGLAGLALASALAVAFVLLGAKPPPAPPVVAPAAPAPTPAAVAPAPPPPAVADPPSPVPASPTEAAPTHAPAAAEVVPAPLGDDAPTLTIDTTPNDATVTIDGEFACTSPCAVRVAFGPHDVRLGRSGAQVDRRVNVLQDTTLRVTFDDAP